MPTSEQKMKKSHNTTSGSVEDHNFTLMHPISTSLASNITSFAYSCATEHQTIKTQDQDSQLSQFHRA